MGYIRIRPGLSWHVILTWTRVPGRARTLCGRTIGGDTDGDTAADFGGERTCETCFRAKARAEERDGASA